MSCGDLDGDIYLVIWEQELVDLVPEESIKEPAPAQGSSLGEALEEFV